MMAKKESLFDRLGGETTLEKVHEIFYDKVYADPWLKKFFAHRKREVLQEQQNRFMAQLMGGPKLYAGQSPNAVHCFIMVTDELFELRSSLLSQAIEQVGVSDELRKEWLVRNDAFKKVIVKSSIDECKKQYGHQEILDYSK